MTKLIKENHLTNSNLIKIVDLMFFWLIIAFVVVAFKYKGISNMIDSIFLPEIKNPGYYEILDNKEKWYISDELYNCGTKNLMANYLNPGERNEGYSIEVHPDGSFAVSGSYKGENPINQYLMDSDRRLILPEGDYVLCDGGASSQEISLRVLGLERFRGGDTKCVTLASLPEQACFHWGGDTNTELIIDVVISPGFSAEKLEFYPMLLKEEDVSTEGLESQVVDDCLEAITEGYKRDSVILDSERIADDRKYEYPKRMEYQPCLSLNYNWENEGDIARSLCYQYNISKGALDGEIVTRSDWKMLMNAIRYQMQADCAVIDLRDGTGIEITKERFPIAVYGRFDDSKIVREGKEINITDYQEVMGCFEDYKDELCEICDFYDYLKALEKKDYTVFISVKDEGTNQLNNISMEMLRKLGVESQLAEREKDDSKRKRYYRNSYYAILKSGKAVEEVLSKEKIEGNGKLENGSQYSIFSAGLTSGEVMALIQIDGTEYSMNLRGLNLVVYDEDKHDVVDSVCFDTYAGLCCRRQSKYE